MKAVNTNRDKTISRDELEVYAKKRFAALEADHDQTLDQKELKGRLGAAGIAAADVDKDKTVDEASSSATRTSSSTRRIRKATRRSASRSSAHRRVGS